MRDLLKALARVALTLVVLWTFGATAADAANSGFVTAQGGEFRLNGQRFRFVGTNSYYLVDAAIDRSLAHADDTMAMAKSLGFTVLRTWAFLDGPNAAAALQPQ